jgi:hypothetical protein
LVYFIPSSWIDLFGFDQGVEKTVGVSIGRIYRKGFGSGWSIREQGIIGGDNGC